MPVPKWHLSAMVSITMLAMSGLSSWSGEEWPARVHFGVVPVGEREAVVANWTKLTKHLEKELKIHVSLITGPDYQRIIDLIATRKIDFAYVSPRAYVPASEQAEIEPIALQLNSAGLRGFHGLILSKKGSGIDSLEKAKGKVFAFTDKKSMGGFLLPQMLFARDLQTTTEKHFSKILFSGSHQASLLGLKKGTYQVVATNDLALTRIEAAKLAQSSEYKVLWKSDLVPGAPLVARADLPKSLKRAFFDGLRTFAKDKDALRKLGFGGFDRANDRIYNVVRHLVRLEKEMMGKEKGGSVSTDAGKVSP